MVRAKQGKRHLKEKQKLRRSKPVGTLKAGSLQEVISKERKRLIKRFPSNTNHREPLLTKLQSMKKRGKIKELQDTVARLQEQLNASVPKVKVEADTETFKGQIKTLQEQVARFEASVSELLAKLAQSVPGEEHDALRVEKIRLETTLEDEKRELTSAANEITALHKRIAEVERTKEEVDSTVRSMTEELKYQVFEAKEAKAQLEEAMKKLEEANTRVRALEEEITSLRTRLEEASAHISVTRTVAEEQAQSGPAEEKPSPTGDSSSGA